MEEIAYWVAPDPDLEGSKVHQVVVVLAERIRGTASRKCLVVKSLVGWVEPSLLFLARVGEYKAPAVP